MEQNHWGTLPTQKGKTYNIQKYGRTKNIKEVKLKRKKAAGPEMCG